MTHPVLEVETTDPGRGQRQRRGAPGLPTDKMVIGVVCTLDTEKLREEGGPKVKAARRVEEKCWQLASPKVQPALTTPPPMTVGKRAGKLEVTMAVPYTFVRQILTSNGSST